MAQALALTTHSTHPQETEEIVKITFIAGMLGGLLALALTGCATTAPVGTDPSNVSIDQRIANPDSLADVLHNIKADTIVDLDAALLIAQEPPVDQEAVLCYPVLKKFLGTSTPTGAQIKGVISTFEKARKTRKGVGGTGVPSELKIACAPLLMDERLFLIRLGILTGGVAGSGGLLAPALAPALPLLTR